MYCRDSERVANVFHDPQLHRTAILEQSLVDCDMKKYSGKAFLCLFLTRFCGVGCPFCFFKSAPPKGSSNIEDQFTKEGVEKLLHFINEANVGYLQISGGGEPFQAKEALLECLERAKADRIMLVTSGSWAVHPKGAERYLDQIAEALSKRKQPARTSVRLSISGDHSAKLGTKPILNLLSLFETKYRNHPHLSLQLKTFEGDKILDDVLSEMPGTTITPIGENASDDPQVIKVIPQKYEVEFPSGYRTILGVSRVFEPGLRPNINDYESIRNTIHVYDLDVQESEADFPAVAFGTSEKPGLDWLIEYNGNVCTWQNRVQDNLLNVYEDDYPATIEATFRDPLTLSFIEKGSTYREKIISEVSPRAVTLKKAVSVRDYAGTLLFEDEKVRLYYTIRVLQEYIAEGKVDQKKLETLPKALQQALSFDKESLQKLYHSSLHSIVDQEIRSGEGVEKFRDFLELVKLGHYDMTEEEVNRALKHYNTMVENPLSTLAELEHQKGFEIERRLTQRVMKLKPMKISHG